MYYENLRNHVSHNAPFLHNKMPVPTDISFFTPNTSDWFIADSADDFNSKPHLSYTCSRDDVITPDNLDNALWYYDPLKSHLYIPLPNAHLIIKYLYDTDVAPEVAKTWLANLEFSQRFVMCSTKYIYAGVTFEGCEPPCPKTVRCVVLDVTIPDKNAVPDKDIWDMQDRAKEGNTFYAQPSQWRKRHTDPDPNHSQLDGLTGQPAHTAAYVVRSKKRAQATYQHKYRLIRKYGENSKEFHEAMAAYEKGEKTRAGRTGSVQSRLGIQIGVAELVQRLSAPDVNRFYGDLTSVTSEGEMRLSEAPIVSQQALLAPARFSTRLAQSDYDYSVPPLAWTLEERDVRVATRVGEEECHVVKKQITRVAVALSALVDMPEYQSAQHFVGVSKELNPVTGEAETCAVFDVTYYNDGKRKKSKRTQTGVLTERVDELTKQLEEVEAKVGRLGKAFHALMEVIQSVEERVSQSAGRSAHADSAEGYHG